MIRYRRHLIIMSSCSIALIHLGTPSHYYTTTSSSLHITPCLYMFLYKDTAGIVIHPFKRGETKRGETREYDDVPVLSVSVCRESQYSVIQLRFDFFYPLRIAELLVWTPCLSGRRTLPEELERMMRNEKRREKEKEERKKRKRERWGCERRRSWITEYKKNTRIRNEFYICQ